MNTNTYNNTVPAKTNKPVTLSAHEPTHLHKDQVQASNVDGHNTLSAGQPNTAPGVSHTRMQTSGGGPLSNDVHPSARNYAGEDVSRRTFNDQTQTSHTGTHSGRRTSAASGADAPHRTHIPAGATKPTAAGASAGGTAAAASRPTAGGIDHPNTANTNERKPTVSEKIKGNLEKISGRMTDNPIKVAHGENLAHAPKPAEH